MKNKLVASSTAAIVFGSFIFATPASAATINVTFGNLNFGAVSGTEQVDIIGSGAGLGFTHRYDDVYAGVDAIATVLSMENIDSDDDETNGSDNLLDEFDDSSSTTGANINIYGDIFGDSGDSDLGIPPELVTGKFTIRIDFVEANTTTAVTLQNIGIRVADIDSRQFAQFAGISAYELSATGPSLLSVTNEGGAYEFSEPLGVGSESDEEENWVAVEYTAASSITMTLGSREAGSAFFGVAFTDTAWTETPTRVVPALTPYTLTYDGNDSTSGSAPASQSSTTLSSTVTLAAPQGTLLNGQCSFAGWNTKADGTGANYLNSSSITLTANATLFAKWDCENPITVPEEEPESELGPTESQEELADTGASLDGLALAGLFAIIAGTGAFVFSRRKRA